MFDPEYLSYVEKGSQAPPRTVLSFKDTLGKEITRYINDPDYARRYRADDYNYQDVKRLDKLTDDEKNVIRAMASKGDYEGIEGYYGLIERDLNERVQNERNAKVREFSYDYPVLAGVGNVASSFATPFAFFENAGQAIKKKIRSVCVCRWEMEEKVRFYFCFEGEKERPDLKPNYKGWTVWATVDVDKETAEVTVIECVLPNGERIK